MLRHHRFGCPAQDKFAKSGVAICAHHLQVNLVGYHELREYVADGFSASIDLVDGNVDPVSRQMHSELGCGPGRTKGLLVRHADNSYYFRALKKWNCISDSASGGSTEILGDSDCVEFEFSGDGLRNNKNRTARLKNNRFPHTIGRHSLLLGPE